MEYVIIERIAHYSANIINYGPWSVDMRMKPIGKRDYLGKRGIVVHLTKNVNVLVGDYAVLQVTWYPTRDKFSEKSTNVKYTIYIEVSHVFSHIKFKPIKIGLKIIILGVAWMHDSYHHKRDSNLSIRHSQYEIFGLSRCRRGRMFGS